MKSLKLLSLVAIASMLFVQCSPGSEETSSEELTSSTISGSVIKGPVANAVVTIYKYSQDGTRGELLISSNSAQDGSFEVKISYEGVVEIVVTGGTFIDEASMSQVNLGSFELRSIENIQGDVTTGITALTTIAAAYIDENANGGLLIAIENANRVLVAALGVTDLDISTTIPFDLSQSINIVTSQDLSRFQYAALQAGLSQVIETNNLNPEDLLILINDLAEDFRDGLFDAQNAGELLTYISGLTPEQSITGLSIAIENYFNSPQNSSGFSFTDIFGN